MRVRVVQSCNLAILPSSKFLILNLQLKYSLTLSENDWFGAGAVNDS